MTQQGVQAFAVQLKQYTGEDFNDRTVLKMEMLAHAAAVDISMAELNNVSPSVHDPRHCRNSSIGNRQCFEQWAYENIESKLSPPNTTLRTKLMVTDVDGLEESISYCEGLTNGLITYRDRHRRRYKQ